MADFFKCVRNLFSFQAKIAGNSEKIWEIFKQFFYSVVPLDVFLFNFTFSKDFTIPVQTFQKNALVL
jgi:hypothetical protein